jgi:acylphosphatase
MKEKIRKRFIFSGRVQGVGFRWHARHAAESLRLTGWVRNEYDGSVSMEVQGTEAEIDRMLVMLQQDRYIDIRDMESKVIAVDEEERSFRVSGY